MNRLSAWAVVCAGCFLFWTSPARSQSDWTTPGYDAQRSSWIRADPKISTTSVQGQDFKLLWKMKLDNQPRQLNSLTPPVLFDFYIGYRGFRSFGFVSGSSGKIFAIDTDLARMDWEKLLGSQPPSGSLDCPGGMTANLTRPTAAAIPPLIPFVGRGRRNPASSGVGKPNEGAVTLAVADGSGFRRRPRPVSSSSRVRAAPIRSIRGLRLVYALSNDGMLHTMYVSNGQNRVPPMKFLPPNANAQGLIVVDDVAYVATTNGCGGVADGVWALDLESEKVTNWKSKSGGVAGLAGPAFGAEGTLYAATAGGAIVALEAKTLKQVGSYAPGGAGFTSSPVVIDYNEKDYLAVTAKDGTIHLLDGTKLGGSNGRTPVDKTPAYAVGSDFVPGALATWQDSDGTKWVLAPSGGAPARGANFPTTNGQVKNGAIVAWKVADENGSPSLEPGWISRDMISPLPPIVVNGVVFAASSGAFRASDASMSAEQRAQRSSPAKLYALDGATGKVLWESGDSISSFAPNNGLSAGAGAVYLSDYEGTLYCFGFPMEH